MDAFVIGSGPNGLTAAITLARAGLKVTVLEAQPVAGGGTRSAELTLPGYVHDVCSAVHPMAVSSPAFSSMPLDEHGLEWIHPAVPLAHPLDGGRAAVAESSIDATAARLGRDGSAYRRLMTPRVAHWRELLEDILAPPHLPKHPLVLARFGLLAPWPAAFVAHRLFREEPARALFAGMAAHSILPLEMKGSAAIGWVMTLAAHAAGWPIARGGSQRIADALVSYLKSLGGNVVTNCCVRSLQEFPTEALVLCDVTPRQLVDLSGGRLPDRYCRRLAEFKYGPGVFKVDWALREPIPWTNADCRRAGTLHLGGSLEEIAASEKAAWQGSSSQRPFVFLSQPTLFDRSRAPEGRHAAWGYCHVPNGSTEDMTSRIEAQVERFAPGFRDIVRARHSMSPVDLEAHNANLVGGDIGAGANTLKQLFLRPTAAWYRTPARNVYLCSASTPPGAGVHGMSGYHAATTAIRDASLTIRRK
jgi:phytoene dehydrogenase-like protein